jgi:hypothetical protein
MSWSSKLKVPGSMTVGRVEGAIIFIFSMFKIDGFVRIESYQCLKISR